MATPLQGTRLVTRAGRDLYREWAGMEASSGNNNRVGLSLGGSLVIAGILLVMFWSFWWGFAVGLTGLAAFGGFVRGRWY